jgi:hypothetical protein
MLTFLLDNSYVTFRGKTYKQIQGIGMGLSSSTAVANLFCGFYELSFMIRKVKEMLAITNIVERPIEQISFLNAIFNASRFIDDILLCGLLIAFETFLYDRRAEGGEDGIYPSTTTDPITHIVTQNTMQVNEEQTAKQGETLNYLDLTCSIPAGPLDRKIHTRLYSKRTTMQIYEDYCGFPSIDSRLTEQCKYNTLQSALHRFARIHSKPTEFSQAVRKLISSMYSNGYATAPLIKIFRNFRHKYTAIFLQAHATLLTKTQLVAIWDKTIRQIEMNPISR